jgi:hypothetical protein
MDPGDGGAGVPGAVGPFEITDADLTESAPRVRALVVARLEQVWTVVQARLNLDSGGEAPIDPRLLEIGLRTTKELSTLYRLNRAPAQTEEEEELEQGAGVDRAALIESKLAEIENKMRKQES